MFTIKDILALAVQIESNGEEIYRRALHRNTSKELAELLFWIAEEEARHGEWFEEMGRGAAPEPVEGPLEKMARVMLRSSLEEQSFSLDEADLSRVDEADRLLAMSIEFEEDTVAFYRMMRPFLQNTEVIEALDRIIEEEQRHIEKLGALKEELTSVEDGS
ncbi:MAG: ferritin family protein [Desulfobacterales bacterium]|nr:ferritin family protein [Desulfobacterales bacterium]